LLGIKHLDTMLLVIYLASKLLDSKEKVR